MSSSASSMSSARSSGTGSDGDSVQAGPDMSNLSAVTREHLVVLAHLAEKARRFDDMVAFCSELVFRSREEKDKLTTEERNLFSVSLRGAVGERRRSLRLLNAAVRSRRRRHLPQLDSEEGSRLASEYQDKVVMKELIELCNRAITMIKEYLLDQAHVAESEAFYFKMLGDYERYLAEFLQGRTQYEAEQDALYHYELAEKAASSLPDDNPIKLGLALNLSIFCDEILKDRPRALEIARSTLERASGLEEHSEHVEEDAKLALQLLKDNIEFWEEQEQKRS